MNKAEAIKQLKDYVKDCNLKGDKDELKELIKIVKEGNFKKAYKYLRSADTYVREGIPQEVWNYIQLSQFKTEKVVKMRLRIKPELIEGDDVVLKNGDIATLELIFPGNATKREIAMGVINSEDDFMKQFVEVEYLKPKRRKRKSEE
tara:strand:- start:1820 stop:2260 length:441 start_codon:yes stop_codon:yes gene_type:complete